MANTTETLHPLTRFAVASSSRSVHAMAPAVACFALAMVFADHVAGLVFLVAGISLATAAAIVWLLSRHYRHAMKSLWSAAAALCDNDPTPCFGTDAEGALHYRNRAAKEQFAGGAQVLSEVLERYFAAPGVVVARLRAAAEDAGAASEDVASSNGCLRLAVHRIDGVGYLWRVEEIRRSGDCSWLADGLPAMRIAPPRTILEMNAAMENLLGGRPARLDRVTAQLPLEPGRSTVLQTAAGPLAARLAILDGDGDSKIVYVWPGDEQAHDRADTDAIPVPMMRIAPDGRILMANARAKALLALEPEDNKTFGEVIEGLGRPVDEWLLDVVEGRGSAHTEVVRATLPSQDVYLQVSLGRVVEHGEVSIMAILVDATELKTLEAQFVQSQKMQAIGQLAGGVAHDFNNLLTAISGHCDLLMLRHEPGDPNYGDLVQINQNANRAASLVGQLLAFSRKQNMQPELIDLRDTLSDLTHLLNRLVGEKIELGWKYAPDLPRVRADKRHLEQVLMNLVVNARDAMPDGGRIEIECAAETLTEPLKRDRAEVPAGEYVVVRVRDQGCGIAGDKLQKIFEPFYSTKKTGEGTGLGLSMAYGIVKQSGGFIFADSVLGEGSVFTLYFPAHRRQLPVAASPQPKEVRTMPKPKGGNVLLVEDEAPVRAFASRALRLRGYNVIEADCGEDALEKLDDPEMEIDVFVTDVVMPGMDGPTWVAKALEKRPGVKVVFVSGYAEDSVSHNRARIPNSAFLPKPFSLSQLTETVSAQFE